MTVTSLPISSTQGSAAGTDALKHVRELPDDILMDLGKLVVNRRGDGPTAYMITEDIIGHVAPERSYLTTLEGLILTDQAPGPTSRPKQTGAAPDHVRFTGTWDRLEDVDSKDANILGGFGTLTLKQPALHIPAAAPTVDALAYYGARLIKLGDPLEFETDHNLPVALMAIGATYVEDYLKIKDKGGGAYIEDHDRPHLHMPIETDAGGHMLLGCREGDDYLLSAFPIPYGTALYTPPYALHADAFLVGRYLVVYSVTKHYSTVVFMSEERDLIDVSVG
jgi:hypothetical protein